MMYQFLAISLRLPYRPLQRFESERNQPVNAPQVKSEEDDREQHDDGGAPNFGARRPRGLAHLLFDLLIELADAPEDRELRQLYPALAAVIRATAANWV